MGITKPIFHSELAESEVKRRKYAFPEQRRFPLTDRDHVLSAIKFFNYAKPDEEATLAKAIIKRMGELGMDDVNVGDKNRFKNYYKQKVEHGDMIGTRPIFEDDSEHLKHYGVKGMKWHQHLKARAIDTSSLKNMGGSSSFDKAVQSGLSMLWNATIGPVVERGRKQVEDTWTKYQYASGNFRNRAYKGKKKKTSGSGGGRF